MKKIVLLVATIFALTGCAAHRTSNADKLQQSRAAKSSAVASSQEKKKESVKITSKTVYYHQLTKADRDKVTFAFQAFSDTSKAESGQLKNAPSPFTVDMQVTNKSNKTVKLDESKVVWLEIVQNGDPITSDKAKTITIKPNQTRNVVELFSDFNNQNFVDAGAFCYLNSDYKLAYSYLAYKQGGVTSKNLTDKKLIAMNTPSSATSNEQAQPSSDPSESASSSDTSDPIGVNNNPNIKVTPASQFSSFAFTNTTDHPITISPESIMLVVNGSEMTTPPQAIIDAGDVVIDPGQTHNYVGLFGDAVNNADALSIALDTGGNVIWSWDGQSNN
ncbi:hypothetical protein ACFQ5J_04685 [Lacticaseibacillus baoqingensis]|uniref:DUF4352 domain-containing protein n=1 Tax=Lacticaseibacillus baoqingensis TaxID=2486013 RepID=A0ABW4E5Y8_9LACO|nr:hypothetical protein [Lacticaseibacillus baoqingensis]